MARKSDIDTPRNILIVRFSALGDVCMTIPVVYGFCRANPEVRFVYLTKKPVAALFIGAPSNLVVEGVDLKKQYHGPWGAMKLIHSLIKKYHIDAIADLHSVLRSHIMDTVGRLYGVRVARIDKMRRLRQDLTSRGAAHAAPLPSMISRYAQVFTSLGLASGEGNIQPPAIGCVPPATAEHVLIPKHEGERWIAVAPYAAHRGKIYPIELMQQVVSKISQLPDTTVILFGGGGDEAATLDKWAADLPHVINLAGKKHGFAVELAIMAQCDLMVSMDSANMHLASLMGTPVVSIWGATHPAAGFSGWRQNPTNAVQADISCRPCSVFGNKVCHRGTYECLSAITPDMIVDKVKAFFTTNTPNPQQ